MFLGMVSFILINNGEFSSQKTDPQATDKTSDPLGGPGDRPALIWLQEGEDVGEDRITNKKLVLERH